MIKHSNGMYTPEQIRRCSRMAGTFQKEVRSLVKNSVTNTLPEYEEKKQRSPKHDRDLNNFVKDFSGDGLFTYCPPRMHSAFGDFQHKCNIKSIYKFGTVLKKQSVSMDKWDNIVKKSKAVISLNIDQTS